MCIECPHKREHEVGDEICIVDGGKKPHCCHMATHLICAGSQMQYNKIQLNMVQLEDYASKRVINTKVRVNLLRV